MEKVSRHIPISKENYICRFWDNEVPESLTLNPNDSISLHHDTEKDCKRINFRGKILTFRISFCALLDSMVIVNFVILFDNVLFFRIVFINISHVFSSLSFIL